MRAADPDRVALLALRGALLTQIASDLNRLDRLEELGRRFTIR